MRFKKINLLACLYILNMTWHNELESTKTLQKPSLKCLLVACRAAAFLSQAPWNEKSLCVIPDIQLNTPLLPYHYTIWSPVMFPEHQNSVHRERAKTHIQCNSILYWESLRGNEVDPRSALSLASDVRQGGAGQRVPLRHKASFTLSLKHWPQIQTYCMMLLNPKL